MVSHHDPPGRHHWEWVSVRGVTITPESWIELRTEAVAPIRYPARCLAHKCPGHPNKSPLYMALHAPGALPSR